MSTDNRSTALRNALGEFAPKLVDLTDGVLFGDVWERQRSRSAIAASSPAPH